MSNKTYSPYGSGQVTSMGSEPTDSGQGSSIKSYSAMFSQMGTQVANSASYMSKQLGITKKGA